MPEDLPKTVPAKPGAGLAATEPSTPKAGPVVPETVGRFAIRRKLGEGGMGVVLLGFDPKLERKVAIKLLRPSVASAPASGGISRLLREAHAMARLEHDNVITVHEVGEHDGRVFVAMEFIDGGTLTEWNDRAQRTVAEVVEMHVRAGRGLAAAHAAGLVHRDFKPDNVLVAGDGRVRVTDFGLVRSVDDPEELRTSMAGLLASPSPLGVDLTRTGTVMGTPLFMAPEQHRGERAGPEVDQFAFCVSLYAMLANAPPFSGTSYAELAHNVLSGRVERLERYRDVPRALADAIHRGLSVEPAERFASMEELLEAITAAIDESGVAPTPRRRSPVIAVASVVVVAVVAVVAAAGKAPWESSGAEGSLLPSPGLSLERVALPPVPLEDQISEPPAGERPWAAGVSDAEQKEALRLFDDGNQRLATGQFSEATSAYREALGHWNHPAIQYNLSLSLMPQGRPVEIGDALAAALRYGAAPLDQDRFERGKQMYKDLRRRTAQIELSCELPDGTVSLGGDEVSSCPGTWEGRIETSVAQTLVVRRDGDSVWSEDLQLAGNSREGLNIRSSVAIWGTEIANASPGSASARRGLFLERVSLPVVPDEIAEPPAGKRPWADGVSDADQRAANRLVTAANKRVAANEFPEAASAFLEALGHWDNPAIHYNLAKVYIELAARGQPVDRARVELELLAAVRFGATPLGVDRFAEARRQLATIRTRLGWVELSCEQAGSVVLFAGEQRTTCPGTWAGSVEAGVFHDLIVRRPDGEIWAQSIRVTGGSREAIKVRGEFVGGGESAAREAFERGQLAFKSGNFDEAVVAYQEVYGIDPTLHAILFNIGEAYRQAGNCQQAVFFYKRFLDNYPEAPNRDQVEGFIKGQTEICDAAKKEPTDAMITNLP